MAKRNIIAWQEYNVFQAFSMTPKTLHQVASETGISSITVSWYMWEFLKTKRLFAYCRDYCPVAGKRAMRYTTNPNRWGDLLGPILRGLAGLSNEDLQNVFEAVKRYYFSNYQAGEIAVADSVRGLWKNVVKPGIDRRVWK